MLALAMKVQIEVNKSNHKVPVLSVLSGASLVDNSIQSQNQLFLNIRETDKRKKPGYNTSKYNKLLSLYRNKENQIAKQYAYSKGQILTTFA